MKQRRFDEVTQMFIVNAGQMAYLENAPKTQMMLQISCELLRYFYNGDTKVLLSKELEALRNYIEIQKIRYGNRFDITYVNYSDFEDININHLSIIDFVDHILNNALVQYEGIIDFTVELKCSNGIFLKVILKKDMKKEEFLRPLAEMGDADV